VEGREQPEIDSSFTIQYYFSSSFLLLLLYLLRTCRKSGHSSSGADLYIWAPRFEMSGKTLYQAGVPRQNPLICSCSLPDLAGELF